MQSNNVNTASAYFNENWQRYQSSIMSNTLYHREMLIGLKHFLSTHFNSRSFSFVDVGCGDSSTVAPVLADFNLTKYTGIDAAEDVLNRAPYSLEHLTCAKEFIAGNMISAIPNLASPVDVIFTSYAVHHLTAEEKFNFVEHCKEKLNPNGFLLMVDGVRQHSQTRDEWLDALQERMQHTVAGITTEEVIFRMRHPRADDFPELMETFVDMAQQQKWSSFEVIVDKGIFAFMVFAK